METLNNNTKKRILANKKKITNTWKITIGNNTLNQINLQNVLYYEQKKVKLGIRWECVHKDLCNGTVTTDEEITTYCY
ncbi:FLYWCH-type domain-containing protein, partial [Aphis craccivora]